MGSGIDADRIKKRIQYYQDKYSRSLSNGDEDIKFYRGKQVSAEVLEQVTDEEGNFVKPCETFNHIKPHINSIKGQQSASKYYFKVITADDADPNEQVTYDGQPVTHEQLAELLTEELNAIEERNDGEYELSACFNEAVSGRARSYIEVFVREDKSQLPYKKDVLFERRGAKRCFPDPDHEKYDLSDCKDFIKYSELTKEDLVEMFPDKKRIIEEMTRQEIEIGGESVEDDTPDDNKQMEYNNEYKSVKQSDWLVLVEYYSYEYEKEWVLLTPELRETIDNEQLVERVREAQEAKKAEMMAQGIQYDYLLGEIKRKVWNVTSYISGQVVGHERLLVNDVPLEKLPFAEYACDREPSIEDIELRDISLVTDLKGCQRIYNKSKNATMSHLLSSIHSGIVAEEGALVDEKDWEEFGSSPGFVGIVKKGAMGRWQQLSPTPLSQGHAYLSQDIANEMRYIGHMGLERMGHTDDDNKSGKAKEIQVQQGEKGTSYVFDAFRRTKHILCKILLEHICALKGVDYKKLKVVVDDTAESPTQRYANYLEIKSLFESGILQSPYADLIIDMMNINGKDVLKQRYAQVNKFMQWQQERKMEAEAKQMAIEDAKQAGII